MIVTHGTLPPGMAMEEFLKKQIKFSWKIRCIVMWTFRILAVASFVLEFAGLVYLAATAPAAFNAIFTLTIFTVLALFFPPMVLEGMGRLLSWTKLDLELTLPRFIDGAYNSLSRL